MLEKKQIQYKLIGVEWAKEETEPQTVEHYKVLLVESVIQKLKEEGKL